MRRVSVAVRIERSAPNAQCWVRVPAALVADWFPDGVPPAVLGFVANVPVGRRPLTRLDAGSYTVTLSDVNLRATKLAVGDALELELEVPPVAVPPGPVAGPLSPGPGPRTVAVTIEGSNGPGVRCPGWSQVEVSVQVGKGWQGAAKGNVARYRHTVEVSMSRDESGVHWRGSAAHGRGDDRFLYLVWTGVPDAGGERKMFARAKLLFEHMPAEVASEAGRSGSAVVRLSLRDPRGLPVAGTPVGVEWSVS